MNGHSYNLRSRVNSPAAYKSPVLTPVPRPPTKNTWYTARSPISIQLDHVIGTTARHAGGLSACAESNSFAYCAGSVAVLAHIAQDGEINNRFFRARPTVEPVNATTSYYDTPSNTPNRKRSSFMTPRKDHDHSTPRTPLFGEDSPKTWTARERIKSITSVSLSANGRFLAVGETGYNPRVLIFNAAKYASTEIPLSVVTDHTWGVKSVAFSPDSRYLATLGEVNDGYLFVWSVHPRTGAVRLLASNKCTTNVCHMAWCGERLVTVGTRHIKIWQLYDARDSPGKRSRLRESCGPSATGGPVPLSGRNCLLGSLVDATFTCIVGINDQYALVCADTNELCVVDVSKVPAELSVVKHEVMLNGAMAYRRTSQRLIWAGGGHHLSDISVFDLISRPCPTPGMLHGEDVSPRQTPRNLRKSILRQSLGIAGLEPRGVIALECLADYTIMVDREANLVLLPVGASHKSAEHAPLSSHNEPVQGVAMLPAYSKHGVFYTWSKGGELRFWNDAGHLLSTDTIELDQGSDPADAANNELKIARYLDDERFLYGDRFGLLKLVRCSDGACLYIGRAHSAEINDIAVDRDSTFVATCSRDRMVQIFHLKHNTLELIQTTDDHIAAVNQLLFNSDGSTLLSCSADRTIVVRDKAMRDFEGEILAAFLQTRIITIKAAPLSMCLMPGKDTQLCVSTLDRCVTRLDFTKGSTLSNFKIADGDMDDTAVLSAIQIVVQHDLSGPKSLLIGCSSTDKSVRVYDFEKHSLLAKESAHTEGVSDLVLFRGDGSLTPRFVSAGHDSTVMLWSVVPNCSLSPSTTSDQPAEPLNISDEEIPVKTTATTMPPLRRVLSKVDIADFVRADSPRLPSREPSPARPGLVRKSSRLAMTAPMIPEAEEPTNDQTAARRRASADEKTKLLRRSPSPPAYATRRPRKAASRPELAKDFFQRQAEWLPKPTTSEPNLVENKPKPEGANKARLRRPPSVPADLRMRAQETGRKTPAELSSKVDSPSELAYRNIRSLRRRLEASTEEAVPADLEQELQALLDTVRAKKGIQKRGSFIRKIDNVVRPKTTTTTDREAKLATTKRTSLVQGRTKSAPSRAELSPGSKNLEGLAILLERTKLG